MINEIERGANNAIDMMDSEAAKFVARFLKDNITDIVLIAATAASGGTGIAAFLSQMKLNRKYAKAIIKVVDAYRDGSHQGLTQRERMNKLTIAILEACFSLQIKPELSEKFTNALAPLLGETAAKFTVDKNLLLIQSIYDQNKNTK